MFSEKNKHLIPYQNPNVKRVNPFRKICLSNVNSFRKLFEHTQGRNENVQSPEADVPKHKKYQRSNIFSRRVKLKKVKV